MPPVIREKVGDRDFRMQSMQGCPVVEQHPYVVDSHCLLQLLGAPVDYALRGYTPLAQGQWRKESLRDKGMRMQGAIRDALWRQRSRK
ncbi:hypothetical protein GOP47_0019017 [Adiantum capillus-veneris]|uniref:Uncharacterized protein n=1 Tax=Adiantum capillus-veneris TaxID=13818 RepID=A0A9D4UF87_ADICA|nr:hypothetical protein GOP47_0019017 [Adiantum capillus-veneris]